MQKELRLWERRWRTQQIDDILLRHSGFGLIPGIKSNHKHHLLTSVKDANGELQTERQSIVD
eukprot:1996424-Pyramimonas_sp.AAC.1